MPRLRSIHGFPPSRAQVLLDALRPTRIVGSDGEQHALAGGIGVEDGDALVVATSGTSGQPKGVVLTHDAIAASARGDLGAARHRPDRHAWLACLPLAHIGGLAVVTRSIVTGTPLVVLPGFEAESRRGGRALGPGVARVVGGDRAAARSTPRSSPASSSGAAGRPTSCRPNVVATYGMTETGSGVVYDGWPLDGVEVAFRPRRGRMRGADARGQCSEGEILIRAPMLLRCYRDGDDGRVVGPDGRGTGSPPAMPATSTRTASSSSRAASATSSRRARRRSGPTRSNASCWRIPAWPRWRSGSGPTPSGASGSWPGSCPPTTARRSTSSARWSPTAMAPWAAPKELVLVDDLPRTAAGKVRRRALDTSERPPSRRSRSCSSQFLGGAGGQARTEPLRACPGSSRRGRRRWSRP